jgi:hypothetical protein
MKKFYFILFLIFSINAFCQEAKAKKDFTFEPSFRFSVIYPIQLGPHSLAESHRSNPGFEFSMSFFNFKNFRLAAGFDRVQYKVTDHQLVGNFTNSNYTAIYGDISYQFISAKKISVLGDVGAGYVGIQQARGAQHFGNQEGKEFRAGIFGDYRVAKRFSLFVGVHYIFAKLKMETNAEYIDYYGKASQIQFSLGFKLN